MKFVWLGCFALMALSAAAADRAVHSENAEWVRHDVPPAPDAALPNVLLLGDSITEMYFPWVRDQLKGKANVWCLVTSFSIADPRLPGQVGDFLAQAKTKFDVIHFNNGMHGWAYTDDEYRTYFHELYDELKKDQPAARLIWATITPVRKDLPDGPHNARIDARNVTALDFLRPRGVAIDDLHATMLHHGDLHLDDIHFNHNGSALMAAQVGGAVTLLLPGSYKSPTP